MSDLLTVVAVVASGVCVASVVAAVRRPRRRLAGRVRPYAAAALTTLGRPVPVVPVRAGDGGSSMRERLTGALHGGGDDPLLRQRLRQSGVYDVEESRLVGEHRVRQLVAGVVGAGLGLAVALVVGLSPGPALALGVLGGVAGSLRPTARVETAIESRREALRAEVPALCHLLALRLRASGSVVTTVSQTIARSRGHLSGELAEALAQHRAGRPLDDALDAAALATPEPEAARVHRLLAGAIRHGLDVAPELLRLSSEVRQSHLTRLRRQATSRRAAILLPTVGLLAPLMLLFIAAPLPSLVLTP